MSEVRLGVDIPVHSDDEEITSHHYRVRRIENLERCSKLKRLSIVASCVDEIKNLENNSQLQELEIYQGLVTQISSGVSHLINLKVLDLSFNDIRVIENLGPLVHLEKLFLSNNKISAIQGLETLTNLKVLELGSNKIRSLDAPCLMKLENLEELWLGKNKIASMDDLIPCRFPKLRHLSLQSNRLSHWSPDIFSLVTPNLTHLYLGSNQLPDMNEPTARAFNPHALQELDLSSNLLTEIPRFPLPMEALEELWLNDNRITADELFSTLKNSFPNLRTIYIERNPVHTEFPLDCRRRIISNAPETLEQIDASMLTQKGPVISVESCAGDVRSILRH